MSMESRSQQGVPQTLYSHELSYVMLNYDIYMHVYEF